MNASELELEAQISAIARELAADGGGDDQARVFHLGWWSERMLAWAMAHPQFKTQLFRFVDVFPACADDAEVLRHLEEYFDGVPVPRALELGLDLAEHVPLGRVISATAARRNITGMARQFIAGATPAKAMPRLRRLWDWARARPMANVHHQPFGRLELGLVVDITQADRIQLDRTRGQQPLSGGVFVQAQGLGYLGVAFAFQVFHHHNSAVGVPEAGDSLVEKVVDGVKSGHGGGVG